MSRLKAVALVLSGALAEARQEGYEAAERDRLAIVRDRPIAEGNSMPLWLQTDPQWD